MKDIFRKKSLERLSSPEQLDRLLVIIRLPGWISLACLLLLLIGLLLWSVLGHIPVKANGLGIFFDPDTIEVIQASVESHVERIYVRENETVKKGAALFLLRDRLHTLKNETADLPSREQEMLITAPADGTVLTINVIHGEGVGFGDNLLWFQTLEDEDRRLVYSFFSIDMGSRIKPGMKAHVNFDTVQTKQYGKMTGTVKEILFFAGGPEGEIMNSIPSRTLRDYLTKAEATVVVLIEPDRDPSTLSGFRWTTSEGPPYHIHPNSIAEVEVFLEEKRPIEYLIPIGER
ncbi:MAG: HlyD family efflux transporter periplasmic adaptor subunit [Chlamydiales bacterium]|nr:HlyD family efflux transporter periplasmic adaptor subunit [Chlamydiales bacterium]